MLTWWWICRCPLAHITTCIISSLMNGKLVPVLNLVSPWFSFSEFASPLNSLTMSRRTYKKKSHLVPLLQTTLSLRMMEVDIRFLNRNSLMEPREIPLLAISVIPSYFCLSKCLTTFACWSVWVSTSIASWSWLSACQSSTLFFQPWLIISILQSKSN